MCRPPISVSPSTSSPEADSIRLSAPATTGAEKLVPTLEDAHKVIDVLPRNATGQLITAKPIVAIDHQTDLLGAFGFLGVDIGEFR